MSDQTTPRKRGRKTNAERAALAASAPIIPVTPREDEGAWSHDDIVAKRLLGQPFGIRAEAIPIRDKARWQLYIANSIADEGRHYDMVYRKGWTPCTVEDLEPGITPESIGFRRGEDGRTLVRGTRGDEVVYKMPREKYQALQQMKAAENVKGMRSEKVAKEEAAAAAAATHGDQAADYLAKHAQITITDSQQRVG